MMGDIDVLIRSGTDWKKPSINCTRFFVDRFGAGDSEVNGGREWREGMARGNGGREWREGMAGGNGA